MTIYRNRYQANKVRRGDEVIVKVCGGYVLMDAQQYRIWKAQK